MAVSKRLRYEILRRDNHACRYCGAAATPEKSLTIDHVVPVALGGSDDPSNLAAACRDCNAGKSATPADAALVADVAQDAVRWAKAMHAARQQALEDHKQMRLWQECFHDYWTGYTFITPTYRGGTGQPEFFELPHDWRSSIESLAIDGMFVGEMRDAVDVAMARRPDDKFRYFVGIVRNKLAARQETARAMLSEPEPVDRAPALSPTSLLALDVTGHLSRLVDGRMIAEMDNA